jgi:hypothetical protein
MVSHRSATRYPQIAVAIFDSESSLGCSAPFSILDPPSSLRIRRFCSAIGA